MKNAAPQPTAKSRWPTLVVWAVALFDLVAGGLAAGALVLIPTSFDPVETISAGVAPWLDAGYASLAFMALLVATLFALRLWHSKRYRAIGAVVTAALSVCVIWACAAVYSEYF